MSAMSRTPGLAYKKIDLHIHSPASKCFVGQVSPEQIVAAALGAGLDAIAITDHNTAEGIDAIKEASKNTPLIVFPGVEISCTGGKRGIHILALFDPATTSREVSALLNVLGILPHQFGLQEALPVKSPIEVIECIHHHEALAVLAHANSGSGVMADMSGEQRTRIVQSSLLFAVEATDFKDEQKKGDHKRVVDLLDGTDPTYQRKLAVYQASDNPTGDGTGTHGLAGIGSRFSFFKMERVDLRSLRQCFVDPDVRIRTDDKPPHHTYPRIARISIDSGFLENQEATFHPGLNSILGAKGAGKSLLVEFLRFVLNQEPTTESLRRDHSSKLEARLGEFGTVTIGFVDENGKVTEVKRTLNTIDNSPYDDSVPFDPAQIMPVLFLSQNEIIAIAEDETEQLHFIDNFFDFHTYRSRIESLEKELGELDAEMASGLRAFSEYDSAIAKLTTNALELSKIDTALKNPIFEKYQLIEAKENALNEQRAFFKNLTDGHAKANQAILAVAAPSIPHPLAKDPALLRNASVVEKLLDSIRNAMSAILKEINASARLADQECASWHPTYEAAKKEYQDHVQHIGGDYKGLAVSRERLVRQRNDLNAIKTSLMDKKDRVKPVQKRREELLDRLQTEYDAYSAERKAKCEKFVADSQGKLRLTILDQSNVEGFRESLLSLKRGSYLRDDEIVTITTKIKPRQFVLALLRYEATKEAKHLQPVADDCQIDIRRMKTLAEFLLSSIPFETLLALQYRAQPQDRPEILYDVGSGQFQPLSSISVGQKCTAMLIVALSDGAMPIVIDQPEDSLDIRSIWEDVCNRLRSGKEKRQFIFTTHNSSLAVASDTDCFTIVEGDSSHGRIIHSGSMDQAPVGAEVLKYLEGGSETYRVKYEKYGDFKFKTP